MPEQPINYTAEDPQAQERDAALRRAIDESPIIGPGPHIWVGTVDDYIAARPHGRWISTAQTVPRVERDISGMTGTAPSTQGRDEASAWHVFAHTGFGRHEPRADASLAEFVRHAERYREDGRAFAAWAWLGGDDRSWLRRFYEAYQGRFDHLRDWVTLQVEAAGYDTLLDRVVPDTIRPHVEINVESLAHELWESGAVITVKDPARPGVFVFRLH